MAWVALAGCGGATEVAVRVTGPAGEPDPAAVGVNVFDGYGRIGHTDVAVPKLPGTIVIKGLADATVELRIVAYGTSSVGPLLGGARVSVRSGNRVEATIELAHATPDGDGDLVPDALDGCPATADPMQENAAGSGANDACRPVGGGDDLAGGGGGDLAVFSTTDLAAANGDMAGTPPPDMTIVASKCASAGVPFCDGFESATFDPHWTTVVQTNGTVKVDNTRAYRGASSLWLHQNALAAKAWSDVEINETQSFPATHLWVRAFVFVPTVFAADDADFIFMEQNQAPYDGILLGLNGTSFHTNNTFTGTRKSSTTPMPRNQWVCLEWDVTLGASGVTALSVAGTAANGLGGTQNLAPNPAIGQLGLSLMATAPASAGIAARDLWIDEVIVDVQPIGCTK